MAIKSKKTLTWYTVRLFVAFLFLSLDLYLYISFNKTIGLAFSIAFITGLKIYCLVKWIRLLSIPKKLLWRTEDSIIINRRFGKIKVTFNSILRVAHYNNYIRLGHGRVIGLGSGTVHIETSDHIYKIIGVDDVDAVSSMIKFYRNESRQKLVCIQD